MVKDGIREKYAVGEPQHRQTDRLTAAEQGTLYLAMIYSVHLRTASTSVVSV